MTHTVSVGEFEGPLGILLELVERGNLEVTAISVADITAGYLDRIRHLENRSPEALSEFVQLGARLLYIKSLALLPGQPGAEPAQELQQLNLELQEYRRFQQAARQLARRTESPSWERPVGGQLAAADLPLPSLTLTQLAAAFTRALEHAEPATDSRLLPSRISLDTKLALLRRRLAAGFDLDHLLAASPNRLDIIVTFLALLELIRQGSAQVRQTSQFSAITVEAARG